MYDRDCMAEVSPAGPLQSPAELKAQIDAERVGLPFLVYRDGAGTQRIYTLPDTDRQPVGVGQRVDPLGAGPVAIDEERQPDAFCIDLRLELGRRLQRTGWTDLCHAVTIVHPRPVAI